MKRVICYTYRSYLLGCECCSDSDSYYDLYEDDELVGYEVNCPPIWDEEDLREHFKDLEPFDIHEDTQYV